MLEGWLFKSYVQILLRANFTRSKNFDCSEKSVVPRCIRAVVLFVYLPRNAVVDAVINHSSIHHYLV